MRKKYFLLAALALTLMNANTPARADDPWFHKWDHNHDNRWDWNEFRKAHYDWWKAHHEGPRLTDRQLREEFSRFDRDHDGYVKCEEVRDFHHW
jgi:hypothetical protein